MIGIASTRATRVLFSGQMIVCMHAWSTLMLDA